MLEPAKERRRIKRTVSKYAKEKTRILVSNSSLLCISKAQFSGFSFSHKRDKKETGVKMKQINQSVLAGVFVTGLGDKEKHNYPRTINRRSNKEDLNRW